MAATVWCKELVLVAVVGMCKELVMAVAAEYYEVVLEMAVRC